MNTQFKVWMDFAVKSVIVVGAVYLAMVLVFMADFRRISDMLHTTDEQVKKLDKQTQFLTALYTITNPDVLYHLALEDESKGDVVSAARKLSMAAQLSEYHAQQYKLKLSQIVSQGRP